jgi:hypothetical protein
VRFSLGFPPGVGFHGEQVFREFSGAPAVIRTTLEQPNFTYAGKFYTKRPKALHTLLTVVQTSSCSVKHSS